MLKRKTSTPLEITGEKPLDCCSQAQRLQYLVAHRWSTGISLDLRYSDLMRLRSEVSSHFGEDGERAMIYATVVAGR